MDYTKYTEQDCENTIKLHNVLVKMDRVAALAALATVLKQLAEAQQVVYIVKILIEADIPLSPGMG